MTLSDPLPDWKKRLARPGQRLYHYRAVSTLPRRDRVAEVIHTIESGEVYFSPPTSFTDPFDCAGTFDFDNFETVDKDALMKRFEAVGATVPEDHLVRVLSDPAVQAEFVSKMRAISQDYGIFCLTTKRDNPLMWTHYGEGHAGVVLEFTCSGPTEPAPTRVEYSGVRACRLGDDDWQIAKRQILTKATCWEYEDEYRCIRPRNGDRPGHGLAPMKHLPLTGIIFGCRMDRTIRETLMSKVTKHKPEVEPLDAVMHSTRFELVFRRASGGGKEGRVNEGRP